MAAKKQTYEQAMKRLEEIVTRIDRSFIRLTEKSRKYWKRKINDKQFFSFGWNLQI